MSFLLPNTHGGYLPYFLIYQATSALLHTLACYTLPPPKAMKAFSGPNANNPQHPPLLARIYGTKNMYTALIRLYAAYNIDNGPVYDLAMLTFVGVLWLYVTELVFYKTARMREAIFPFVLAGGSLVWMAGVRGSY